MTTPRRLPLILVGSALLVGARLPAQTPENTAQTAMELLEKATEAKSSGDHAGALVFYGQAAAMLSEDPAQQDGMGLLLRADLQRDMARAAHAAGVGDPCAALEKGKAYLDQTRRAFPAEHDTRSGTIVDEIGQQLHDERRRMRCPQSGPPAEVGKPDAALAGHYYLSGVMETGSELLLKADGRFDWYISYGAVDQMASGRWGRTGQTVTLSVDVPATDQPLFRVDQPFPWDEAAERRLRDALRARAADAIAERCPWAIGVAGSPPLVLAEDRPPAGPAERARAEEAKRMAETARDEASRAIAKAAAAGASEAEQAAAEATMSAWYSAEYEMKQAYRVAGAPQPDIGAPAPPAECRLPQDDASAPLPPAQWRGGVGVVVGDPARELRLSKVSVTFVFSDGYHETAKTDRSGWAFVSRRDGAAVEQLILAMPEPVSRSATLAIPPLAEGVQAVAVDTQQLATPPFEVMRLQLQGGDLIADGMGRGRYSRN